jgi:hypothetical protein
VLGGGRWAACVCISGIIARLRCGRVSVLSKVDLSE